MERMHRLIWTVPLALALTGCGANALRLEIAGKVSTSATAVVDQANAAIDRARKARIDANSALIASDPSCSPGTATLLVYSPTTDYKAGNPAPPLCAVPLAKGGFQQWSGYQIESISVGPIPEDALKPTIQLIGAIADYQSALAKILADPNADVQKELEGILAKAGAAQTLAEGLIGSTLPKLPDLGSPQAKSAVALIQFVTDLMKEARKTADVRKLVVARGPKVMDEILPLLRDQLRMWNGIVPSGDLATQTQRLLIAYDQEKVLPGSSFDQRRAMAVRVNIALADERSVPIRQAALEKVLTDFEEVHASLVKALKGEYTAEMRKRIAKFNEERLLSALKLTAEAFAAWGVL